MRLNVKRQGGNSGGNKAGCFTTVVHTETFIEQIVICWRYLLNLQPRESHTCSRKQLFPMEIRDLWEQNRGGRSSPECDATRAL